MRRLTWLVLAMAACGGEGGASEGAGGNGEPTGDGTDAKPDPAGPRGRIEGFGAKTIGGRGGAVYKVTNLGDAGPGSLRDCVSANGPRVCVFEVSGTIELASILTIRNSFLTIAGQTAPSPGIFLKNNFLRIVEAHDILVEHVSVGAGDENPANGDADGFAAIGDSYNVVFNHVSSFFSIDDLSTLYLGGDHAPHDVTYSNSIFALALHDSIHYEGHPHSKGPLVGPGTERTSLVRNVIAHSSARNPQVTGCLHSEVINNVVYNWGARGMEIQLGKPSFGRNVDPKFLNLPVVTSAIGNVFLSGVDRAHDPIDVHTNAGSSVYLLDNSVDGTTPATPWDPAMVRDSTNDPAVRASSWEWGSGASILPNAQVLDFVLSNAGARPRDRHPLAQRVVDDVRTRAGRIINCVSPNPSNPKCAGDLNAGGWPIYAQNTRPLVVPANPGGDDDGDGRTNLEAWIDTFTAEVE